MRLKGEAAPVRVKLPSIQSITKYPLQLWSHLMQSAGRLRNEFTSKNIPKIFQTAHLRFYSWTYSGVLTEWHWKLGASQKIINAISLQRLLLKSATNIITDLVPGQQVNHQDVLGLRIVEIANIVRLKPDNVSLLLWTCGADAQCHPEANLCCGPMPQSFSKLSGAMSTILAAMECPICFDTIPPPVIQCQNGHLICSSCRRRSERCPVCREKYSPGRSLIAEQIFTSLTDAFNLPNNEKLRERLFGGKFIRASDLKYINIQSLSQRSHTQKFLARLMGSRSSSLENLSTLRKSLAVAEDKFRSSKSQSTTEIFQDEVKCGNIRKPMSAAQSFECLQQVCRHPSSSSLNNNKIMTMTTAVSCENLGQSPPPLLIVPNLQHLPCVLHDKCAEMMCSVDLRRHVTEKHQIPILSFGGSSASIRLPPVEPLDNAFLLFRQGVHHNIWLRLHYDNEILFCAALLERSPATQSGSKEEFTLETSIKKETCHKELIDRCDIQSIDECNWTQLLAEKTGIFYTKESLRSTFDNDNDNLLLSVKVLRKDANWLR